MAKVAIIYGSTTGNTQSIAETLEGKLAGHEVTTFDASSIGDVDWNEFSTYILGTSTWGLGDIQDDWEMALDTLSQADLAEKKVAIYGLGDSSSYSDTFVDGMADIYEAATKAGAESIGAVSTDGYNFDASRSVIGGVFVGLPIDEDSQCEKTTDRINAWIATIEPQFI
ncbi:MAG: flavodoxin FldA [Rikenellaceae bacterium]